jgi:signal transduction histidine kinase
VKYSPPGKPVDFMIRREDKLAVFEIRDQGIGIPTEDQARLFEPFHRGGNVGEIPGTGLGMVIVKRCVDLHEGTIELSSAANRGTTVVVRVPVFGKLTESLRRPRVKKDSVENARSKLKSRTKKG